MPHHLGHSRRPIQPRYSQAVTANAPITLTDSPAALRFYGPDGTSAIDLPITDTPSAQRSGGPDGLVSVSLTLDPPSAQRSGGPDGLLVISTALTDTPSGLRAYGPDGALALGVSLTDSPSAARAYGPEGVAGVGVSLGPDMPSGLRSSGPDGAVAVDLGITDLPSGLHSGGPDGAVALGLALTDTPAGCRSGGPDGIAVTAAGGGVTLTDTPSGSRYGGPDGLLALGIVLVGDSPSGVRFYGPDGLLAIGIVLTDLPSGHRLGGPSGVPDNQLSDSPGGLRAMGPEGAMGIALPIAAELPSGFRMGGPGGVVAIGIGADVLAGSGTPSGPRYGGPDGEVLLAFLPTRQPYIPATPLIAPTYSLWVADTRTGKMLWELPAETFTWDSKLNDIGTIRASLAIEQTWDTLSDQDERDPRIMLREILTGPWRFSLVLKWGHGPVWAGPYLSMTRPKPDHVELNGAEIGKIYSRRQLVKPGAISAVDPSADTTVGPSSTKGHTAYVLLSQALAGTGNDLPITVTDPGGSGLDARVYYGYDLANYWEKIQALSAEVDGPEIRFDPVITAGVDGDYLGWVAQIGTPHLGRGQDPWVFDYDINSIIGFDADGSNMSLGVWSSGSGQSRDKLIAHSTDTTLLNIGWPMLETSESAQSSQVSYPLLASHNASILAAYKNPLVAFKLQVPADSDPMVGTYRVGEDFSIDIHGDPIIPDGFYTRRIAAVSGSEKPWVTITDAKPLLVGSL